MSDTSHQLEELSLEEMEAVGGGWWFLVTIPAAIVKGVQQATADNSDAEDMEIYAWGTWGMG